MSPEFKAAMIDMILVIVVINLIYLIWEAV
jgi:hypothetical protein